MKRQQIFVLVWCVILVLVGLAPAAAQDETPVRIIFMHHSTGENLIAQGGVREGFAALGYEFWDHGYNGDGLADPQGNVTGISYDVPDDNTDPDGWYTVFQQPFTEPPTNTLSDMLQYDVIIFKSCFPASNIYDDEMLATYQEYFLTIRDTVDQYPDKIFIAFSTPPLVPNETDAEAAARARQWSEYLTSDEFLAGHPNLFVFDFFSLLADENGYLRTEFRGDEWDSHPNTLANETVGPLFVAFVDEVSRNFVPGEPSAQPVVAMPEVAADDAESGTEDADMPGTLEQPVVYGLIDDFEGEDFADTWWNWVDAGALAFACEAAEPGYDYARALRITLDLPAQLYGGCGREALPAQGWAEADGLSFVWQADVPGLLVSVVLFVGDTPYEVYLETPGLEWTPVTLAWDDFALAEWADVSGSPALDPAGVSALGFTLGAWEIDQQGTIWIDALQLVVAGE
ncbi:MAG: hypothetical protein JW910_12480 [Anaerolineae bacterium]|nr:hypothetical protein [Anaerolineae bacterium]